MLLLVVFFFFFADVVVVVVVAVPSFAQLNLCLLISLCPQECRM